MRRRARIDDNQPEIVRGLEARGMSVQSLAACGDGVPDLLVGFCGRNILLEIKDGSKPPSETRLTHPQTDWHLLWRGQAAVVRTLDEALAVVYAVARVDQGTRSS